MEGKKRDSNKTAFHLNVKITAMFFQKQSADSGKPSWSSGRQGSSWEATLFGNITPFKVPEVQLPSIRATQTLHNFTVTL